MDPGTAMLVSTVLGGLFGKSASKKAGQLSEEQRRILQQAYGWGQEYGPGLLQSLWNLAQNPYENAYERGLAARERQNIEAGYRPVFAQAAQNLSRRGLWSQYSTQPRRMATALDIARGGAVAQAAMNRAAARQGEQIRRLQAFSDILSQLRGGNVSMAGAYQSPMEMYANLASQTAGGIGSAIGNWAVLQWLEKMAKQRPSPVIVD